MTTDKKSLTSIAQETRPALGFRGIWFSLGKKFQHGDKYSDGLGTYTANHVSGRGQVRPGLLYRSTQPYCIKNFELSSTGEFTYPQPWMQTGKGVFHLITKCRPGANRAQSARELYWTTSADGQKWSDDQKLAGFGGHYQVSSQSGGKIGTFFNYHPCGDVDKRTNLYYVQTEDRARTWTSAIGAPLELPLSSQQNAALVLDLESRGELMNGCDLNWDKHGNPVLLYVKSRHGEPREVCVAHFDGDTWRHGTVAACSHNYDMGSLWVDGDSWRVVGPFLEGPQQGQTGGEVGLWSSRDEGQSWRLEKTLTCNSSHNHSYVRRVVNGRAPFGCFWADGDCDRFSQSRLYFSDVMGIGVQPMPYDFE